MPIKVQCQCGKSLNAPEAAAGKAIRCPGARAPLKCPPLAVRLLRRNQHPPQKLQPPNHPLEGSGHRPWKTSRCKTGSETSGQTGRSGSRWQRPVRPVRCGRFKAQSGPSCPGCGKPIRPGAAICTSCGLNLQTGERVASEVAPVKSGGGGGHGGHGGHGTDPNKALAHANEMMQRDQKMQEEMIRGSGLPWWHC